MNQKELNDFKRRYFDLTKRPRENIVCHDPGTTVAHRRLVIEVCEWAHANGHPFFTRAFLKEGKIVDVVVPGLARPFIEVRDSELKKDKEYLAKYEDLIQFVDVTDPFKLT